MTIIFWMVSSTGNIQVSNVVGQNLQPATRDNFQISMGRAWLSWFKFCISKKFGETEDKSVVARVHWETHPTSRGDESQIWAKVAVFCGSTVGLCECWLPQLHRLYMFISITYDPAYSRTSSKHHLRMKNSVLSSLHRENHLTFSQIDGVVLDFFGSPMAPVQEKEQLMREQQCLQDEIASLKSQLYGGRPPKTGHGIFTIETWETKRLKCH